MDALRGLTQFVQFDASFGNLFAWFKGTNEIKPESIDDAIKAGLFGGFKATLTCNYMKELLSMLEIPMLKGLGGLGFNLNMKLKNSDIENFLQNKMVTYLKEALESTMET